MKQTRIRFLLLFTCLALCLPVLSGSAETKVRVQIQLQYRYDMTESMLPLINELRTGDGAWYWNQDDATKTVLTDLEPMIYDYGLEYTAMQRAAECAVHYAHTRPDGTRCFTIYPSSWGMGENIAAGYRTVQSVFEGWREENEPYSGQGHRRNLLNGRLLYIGIGCVYADGVFYWCQALSTSPTGESRTELTGPAIIEATDTMLAADGMTNLKTDVTILWVDEGGSVSVPVVTGNSGGWGSRAVTLLDPPWTSSDETVLTVSDGKATGVSGGHAQLTLNLGGTLTLDATVRCKTHTWDGDTCSVCGEKRTFIPGDVNGDGVVDGRDVLRLMKTLAGQ